MSEMKVGDIGILQYPGHADEWVSGQLAEIIDPYDWYKTLPDLRLDRGYGVKLIGHHEPYPLNGRGYLVYKHQIRPISDPDQETEVDQAEEVSA